MKNLLLVLAIFSGCNLLVAQEAEVKLMTFDADKIIYDGIELDLGMAETIAIRRRAPTASIYFAKAKKMKTWNIVWSALGGCIGAGIVDNPFRYNVRLLDIGIVGGLIGMAVGRKKKISLNMKLGVDAFNEAVLKK